MENIELWILEKIAEEMGRECTRIVSHEYRIEPDKVEYWKTQIENVLHVLETKSIIESAEAKHI
jgi:hypothetical protein